MDKQNIKNIKNQLKGYLKDYVESVTQKSKGTNMYICPICGSGNGKKATGAFSIKNGTYWKCFSCNAGGDIFDLYGAINQITDYNQQLKGLCQEYGINLDDYNNSFRNHKTKKMKYQDKNKQYVRNLTHSNNMYTSVCIQPDYYKNLFLQARKHINETDYPQKRGLSDKTINRFGLGFIANWKHPKAPKAPASPRLIIPTSSESYLARDTRENIPENQKPYSKSKVGHTKIFNQKALQEAKTCIFVVEGELDALSIIEVGGEAVALGSTANTKAFIELLKADRPKQPLIIALDNDIAGEKASEELEYALNRLKISFYRLNIAGVYKDPNEALKCNRDDFRRAVDEAGHIQEETKKIRREEYLKNSAAGYIQDFIDGITDNVNTSFIPSGFSNLDKALDGGLYEGLYIMGAISSLGKTTFVIQMADQIAQNGTDILIFSLEMARSELMSKSISRHTIEISLETGGNPRHAKTAREITTRSKYINYSQAEKDLIKSAIDRYREYAEHIFITEGIGNIGVEQIRQAVKEHILYTGRTPIVIIDYLQILAPYNERSTDKQNTDRAVMELKRISRDYKTPVIGISSFNRTNYRGAVTMEAFKESGAIEYSSDVLMGLQLKGAGEKNFDADKAKRKEPREIELVILKSRNSNTGNTINFKLYPMFNYFAEVE